MYLIVTAQKLKLFDLSGKMDLGSFIVQLTGLLENITKIKPKVSVPRASWRAIETDQNGSIGRKKISNDYRRLVLHPLLCNGGRSAGVDQPNPPEGRLSEP